MISDYKSLIIGYALGEIEEDMFCSIVGEDGLRECIEILLTDLEFYTIFALCILEGRVYNLEPAQKLIVKTIENIAYGKYEIPRLIINVPPGVGKTSIVIWSFLSWMFAINPRSKTLHITRSSELVLDNSDKVKKITSSEVYETFFPIELSKTSNSKGLWQTVEGGAFRATSIFGTATGFRASYIDEEQKNGTNGLLVIDDPNKPIDAHSVKNLNKANQQWKDTFRSRRASNNTPVIVIMQRIMEGDFTDYLLNESEEDWMHLVIPVYIGYENEDGKKWEYNDNGTMIDYDLPKGSIFPKKFSDKEAKLLMSDTKYSQITSSLSGEVILEEWIKIADVLPPIKEYHIKADTASKTNEWNDYTVFSLFGKGVDNKAYHIKILRKKIKVPYLKDEFFRFCYECLEYVNSVESVSFGFMALDDDGKRKRCKIKATVEDKDSGQGLNQTIEDESHLDSRLDDIVFGKIKRSEGKYARALRASYKIKDGSYYIWSEMPEKGKVINEFVKFKQDDSHKNDDIVDTAFDMLNYEIPERGRTASWDY